ncbi:Protein DegV [bioreactor metagenome]|jgi:DegV family protein with EDD domain|uniref:Protein DegV n=1 Tax=bioreactor metagenome TaxID=1076179 RepID=A0A644WE89_9ZZZZ
MNYENNFDERRISLRKIIISTESGSDLPLDLIKRHNIQVVPMHVIMDEQNYPDGSIPVTMVYDYYQQTKKIPSTSSTNPNEYESFFRKINEDNPGCAIIHIAYSSKASSTYQNASIAIKEFDNIYLVDSMNVSGGEAAIIVKSAELAEKSNCTEPEKLVEEIRTFVSRARASFIPGNLEYLKAGGRVSNAAYLGASLLQLKPLIEIIEGKLVSTKKFRGKMRRIAENYINEFINHYNLEKDRIFLLYSLGLDEEIKVQMEQIVKENNFNKVQWIQTGCVISTHSGPGAIGIAGFEIQ